MKVREGSDAHVSFHDALELEFCVNEFLMDSKFLSKYFKRYSLGLCGTAT